MLAPVLPEIGERTDTGPGVAGALVACFALAQLVGYPTRVDLLYWGLAVFAAALIVDSLPLAYGWGDGDSRT
jgi:hypothetical protein